MIQERFVEYEHNGILLEGKLAYDDAGTATKPGVIVVPAWAGRSEFECDRARKLAAERVRTAPIAVPKAPIVPDDRPAPKLIPDNPDEAPAGADEMPAPPSTP